MEIFKAVVELVLFPLLVLGVMVGLCWALAEVIRRMVGRAERAEQRANAMAYGPTGTRLIGTSGCVTCGGGLLLYTWPDGRKEWMHANPGPSSHEPLPMQPAAEVS
jgi:MFS superfamily sulfate permease-like transporter